jgi:hypothetical protein
MNYRHLTLKWSLEGLSPRKLISDMATEGFDPIYSNIVPIFCNFLCKKDPFQEYQEIKARVALKKEDANRVALSSDRIFDVVGDTIATEAVYYTIGDGESRTEEMLPSFGELFKHSKYPDLVFALVDTSTDEPQTWFCCWNKEGSHDHDIGEALDFFMTTVLKIGGCDKSVEEIKVSDTFSLTHKKVLESLKEYDLKQASLEEKKALFELISDTKIKDILIEFNKKGNILLSDFLADMSQEDKDTAERKLNFLSGQGLLDKNLVVICKKTNQWWNMTIPSLNMLSELEKSGVTCTSCGAKITDERVDSLFRISQTGSKLVTGSYWMVGKVVEVLRRSGLRESEIFVDIGYDGEQIDILALAFTRCLIFELKDREFGLGDAYKFHGKVSRIREKTSARSTDRSIIPIVITTKTVAAEARKLLSEVASTSDGLRGRRRKEYLFIEGLDQVEPQIRKLLDDSIMETISERTDEIVSRFPAKALVKMGLPKASS